MDVPPSPKLQLRETIVLLPTIVLSEKEFSILEYLMRHKNSVVTREQVVQSVWNYDTDVLPATVEVHIKHLRDKIDTPFNKQLIKTIRGFGYEIGEDN